MINGAHLVVTAVVFVVGLVFGGVYGWILRGDFGGYRE